MCQASAWTSLAQTVAAGSAPSRITKDIHPIGAPDLHPPPLDALDATASIRRCPPSLRTGAHEGREGGHREGHREVGEVRAKENQEDGGGLDGLDQRRRTRGLLMVIRLGVGQRASAPACWYGRGDGGWGGNDPRSSKAGDESQHPRIPLNSGHV